MISGKQHRTEGIDLPIKMRTLGKKEIYKYLGILEAETIKFPGVTEKIKKNISGELENYSKLI